MLADCLEDEEPASLAASYQKSITKAVERYPWKGWNGPRQRDDDIALLNWLLENKLLDREFPGDDASIARHAYALVSDRYAQLEAKLAPPQRAPAIADGDGGPAELGLGGSDLVVGRRRKAPSGYVSPRRWPRAS